MSTPFTTTWSRQTELLSLAHKNANKEGAILFWSGGHNDTSQQSLLFIDPVDKLVASTWEELDARMQEGIWAGYLGYEMGAAADRDRILPRLRAPTPDSIFYRYKRVYTAPPGGALPGLTVAPFSVVSALETKAFYSDHIEQVLEAIYAGELYQMCLSHECWLAGTTEPFGLFCQIARCSPASFSAYLNCGTFSVISASPERFLSRRGNSMETRPIKGTVCSMNGTVSSQQLRENKKEKAELMMITDLMRNDLGRVSLPGSVRVDIVREIEEYAGVYQAYSIIRSLLRPGVSSVEILRQAFPPGSISGCPKLRAMELIQQVERRSRGVYAGAIGYLWGARHFDFNVAIRTVVAYSDAVSLSLGGAVVADSDPAKEYQETLHKGKRLFEALGVG